MFDSLSDNADCIFVPTNFFLFLPRNANWYHAQYCTCDQRMLDIVLEVARHILAITNKTLQRAHERTKRRGVEATWVGKNFFEINMPYYFHHWCGFEVGDTITSLTRCSHSHRSTWWTLYQILLIPYFSYLLSLWGLLSAQHANSFFTNKPAIKA